MTDILLTASCDVATFCAAVTQALGPDTPAPTGLDACFQALSTDQGHPINLTWKQAHHATIGTLSFEEAGARLRAAAHGNPGLRLVFFDEERGGQ